MIGIDIILFLNAKGAKFFYNLIENILRFAKALRSTKNTNQITVSLSFRRNLNDLR